MKTTKTVQTIDIITLDRHRIGTDGKGITTLIALPGCPLGCKYCLNKKLLETDKIYTINISEFIDSLMVDYCYFISTGGGLTFGGGESLLHIDKLEELAKQLKRKGLYDIRINIETSLNVSKQVLERALAFTDYFIIDIKDFNNEVYKRYTGIENTNVINNLEYISSLGLQNKCKIRIPSIPNYNTEKDIENSISRIKSMGYKDIEEFNYIIREEKQDGRI